MRASGRFALMLVVWLAVPAAAYAQGSITGVVKDASGAVLPGVTVEASSPVLIEKVRAVVTDGTGQYRIVDLRPGSYTVTFTLPGFSTVRREGVELVGAFTATVNADLRVGAVEETITVTGETPTVDVQGTIRQRVLDNEIIDAIPTGRSERNVAVLVPGVSLGGQDVGGSLTGLEGSMTIHGSKGDDQRLMTNGVSLGVVFGGGAQRSSQSNMGAYEEVQIDTGGGLAEYAQGGVRVNVIPKDGGNTFAGNFFGSFANGAMQGDNYSQALKDRGLSAPSTIRRVFDVNPGFGGPIKQDAIWFYSTVRHNEVGNYPAGIFFNANENNPAAWSFVSDPGRGRPSNNSTFRDGQVRLTWQATPKNKIGATYGYQTVCYCLETITATRAPEASAYRRFPRMYNVLTDWTSPVTNRVLLDATVAYRFEWVSRVRPPETNPGMISVTDQALGNLVYRAPPGAFRSVEFKTFFARANASYITGAHAFKAGVILGNLWDNVFNNAPTQPVNYRFNNGVPNLITLLATPFNAEFNADSDSGVYAQDRWTIDRLTLSYGVRYDYYATSFPEQHLGPGPLVPTRNVTFPAAKGVSWHDISPRSGAAYDLFGDGRMALKASLNRYVAGAGEGGVFGGALGPVSRVVLSTTRSWNDVFYPVGDPRRGNYVPDCDLTDPAANAECGAMANRNFGTSVPGASYDPDTLTGWGKRFYNWEFSTGVQREILPRVSADVSYFRRWFGNFVLTDNRTLSPSDFNTFSITAPADPNLPGGGGSQVSGLHDINPAKFGIPADDYVTFADNYGKQIEHWNGVDVTINARPTGGILLQGGLSTGRTSTDICEVAEKAPEVLLGLAAVGVANAGVWMPAQFCKQDSQFLTQVKLLGTYTIPRLAVQISGALQSIPGPLVLANYNAPNSVVAPSLGRPLAGNAQNISITLLAPGTMYGERLNQLDLRFGKIVRAGRTRTTASLDVYNALNSDAVLTQNNTFGGATRWQLPQSIVTARFAKISVQVDF